MDSAESLSNEGGGGAQSSIKFRDRSDSPKYAALTGTTSSNHQKSPPIAGFPNSVINLQINSANTLNYIGSNSTSAR